MENETEFRERKSHEKEARTQKATELLSQRKALVLEQFAAGEARVAAQDALQHARVTHDTDGIVVRTGELEQANAQLAEIAKRLDDVDRQLSALIPNQQFGRYARVMGSVR